MSSPNPEQTGPPLRALAMVLISLAILFAAIGALSLTGSDSDEAAAEPSVTETTGAPAAQAPAAQAPAGSASTSSAATTTSSAAPGDVEVRVLNNSNISGLAAGTADTLTAEGWTVAETGNFNEAQFAETAVYYGTAADEEQAAQKIATQLGVPAEPKPASLQSTDGVVVIVTQ